MGWRFLSSSIALTNAGRSGAEPEYADEMVPRAASSAHRALCSPASPPRRRPGERRVLPAGALVLFVSLGLPLALGACARERGAASSPTQGGVVQTSYANPYPYDPRYGYGQQPGAATAMQPTLPPALGSALIALGQFVQGVLVVPTATAPQPGPAPTATAVSTSTPQPVPTATAGASPPAPTDATTAFEAEVFRLTNVQRAQGATCGGQPMPPVGPLSFHPALAAAARGHSQDMAARGYFDHDTPEGVGPSQRAQAAGYPSAAVGENISSGYTSAAEAMAGWMKSPGHCRNIMTGDYRYLGVGYAFTPSGSYHHYWTQNFGSLPPDSTRFRLMDKHLANRLQGAGTQAGNCWEEGMVPSAIDAMVVSSITEPKMSVTRRV